MKEAIVFDLSERISGEDYKFKIWKNSVMLNPSARQIFCKESIVAPL